jgi:hypothetical protein
LEAAGVFTYPIDVPRTDGLMEAIGKAADALGNLAEQECWQSGDEDCRCDSCQAREAIKALDAALLPVHRSLNPDRLSHAPEEIYLRRWIKEQERQPGHNGGFGLLELLLSPTRVPSPKFPGYSHRPYYVPPVSQRDAEVAATVIQWLGTNCGRCFMEQCEREISTARAERGDYETAHCKVIYQGLKGEVLPRDENLAREAVGHFFRADNPKFDSAVRHVTAAIVAGRANTVDAGLT